jgi:hypothetical protein
MSTGSTVKPSIQVDSITSSGTTVTVVTKSAQFVQPGLNIIVANVAMKLPTTEVLLLHKV